MMCENHTTVHGLLIHTLQYIKYYYAFLKAMKSLEHLWNPEESFRLSHVAQIWRQGRSLKMIMMKGEAVSRGRGG